MRFPANGDICDTDRGDTAFFDVLLHQGEWSIDDCKCILNVHHISQVVQEYERAGKHDNL